MQLAMMRAAERHGELIAHFQADALVLREPQVMRIGRRTATDQAWLLGDEAQMFAVAAPLRLSDRHATPDGRAVVFRRVHAWRGLGALFGSLQAREPVFERFAELLSALCGERRRLSPHLVRPLVDFLHGRKGLKLGEQALRERLSGLRICGGCRGPTPCRSLPRNAPGAVTHGGKLLTAHCEVRI